MKVRRSSANDPCLRCGYTPHPDPYVGPYRRRAPMDDERIKCPVCGGFGWVERVPRMIGEADDPCPLCDGKGTTTEATRREFYGEDDAAPVCGRCGKTGGHWPHCIHAS